MSAGPAMQKILGRLDKVRRTPRGYKASCPAHHDPNPSLDLEEAGDGRVLAHCHAGCDIEDVVAALGLTMSDLFPDDGRKHTPSASYGPSNGTGYRAATDGTSHTTTGARPTLAALSDQTLVPVEFLQEMGWSETSRGVEIKYRDTDGSAARTRIRGAMSGPFRFSWAKGGSSQIVPYGAWRLPEHRGGSVILCEGETDAITLWHNKFVALGIPGAGNAGKIDSTHLDGIERVYVFREPDQGGTNFVSGVAARLIEIGFRGEARVLEGLRGDVSDIYREDPEGFKDKMFALRKASRAVDEVVQEVRAAAIAPPPPEDWPDPEPLVTPGPPPLVFDGFPDPLRRAIEAVAESVQAPSDLAAQIALAVVSAATTGKVEVHSGKRPDFSVPATIWTLTLADSSFRKSPVMKALRKPLLDYETRDDLRVAYEEARDDLEILKQRVLQAKKKAANANRDAREEAQEELRDARQELRDWLAKMPSSPRLLTGDVTPEKLYGLMAESRCRMAIIEPEPEILSIICGLYSNGTPRAELFLRAWTGGEPVKQDRIGRETHELREALLTMGITAQPGVLHSITEKNAELRYRGLLARFLFAYPDRIKRRPYTEAPAIDDEIMGRWEDAVRVLLCLEPVSDDGERYEPHRLELTPGADDELGRFEQECIDRHWDRDLWDAGDVAGKLHGQAMRLAAMIHMVRLATAHLEARPAASVNWEPWVPRADDLRVSAETMRAAVSYVRSTVPHTLRALGETPRKNTLLHHALQKVLKVAEENEENPDGLTVNDVYQAARGKKELARIEDLKALLEELEDAGYLRLIETPKRGRGRSKTRTVQINPKVLDPSSKYSKRTSRDEEGAKTGNSEDFKDAEPAPAVDRVSRDRPTTGTEVLL